MNTKTSVNESKYIRDLKKQITKLKQENAVLRKKNRVMAVTYDDYIDALKELEDTDFHNKNSDIIEKVAEETAEDCPKCNESVQPFEVAGSKFYKCGSCGSKGRLSKT